MTKRITLDGNLAVILGRLASRSGISVGAIANKVLAVNLQRKLTHLVA